MEQALTCENLNGLLVYLLISHIKPARCLIEYLTFASSGLSLSYTGKILAHQFWPMPNDPTDFDAIYPSSDPNSLYALLGKFQPKLEQLH